MSHVPCLFFKIFDVICKEKDSKLAFCKLWAHFQDKWDEEGKTTIVKQPIDVDGLTSDRILASELGNLADKVGVINDRSVDCVNWLVGLIQVGRNDFAQEIRFALNIALGCCRVAFRYATVDRFVGTKFFEEKITVKTWPKFCFFKKELPELMELRVLEELLISKLVTSKPPLDRKNNLQTFILQSD